MTEDNYKTLVVQADGSIARIILNRPELYNRIDFAAHAELEKVLSEVANNPEIRVLVISGEGKHFSAGGDLGELQSLREDAQRRRQMFNMGRHLIYSLVAVPVPVIIAVQGEASGLGASIAALGDIVVVAKDSGLCDPHVAIGLVAGDGGCLAWPLAVGLTRAKRYLLTGERVSGQLAYEMGLATDLVEDSSQVLPKAMELAKRISELAPLAVQGTKRALNVYTKQAMAGAFEVSVDQEERTMVSDDVGEIIAARKERRKPRFKGV